MADQGPGYGLRDYEWRATASSNGPGYGLHEYDYGPESLVADSYGTPTTTAEPAPLLSAPAAPQAGLGVDPAHLAFLRALGLSELTDATSNQVAIDALNRRAGMSLQDVASQGATARQGIADSHEARGLYRSGERLRAQSAQQEGEARQSAGIVSDTADQTSALIAQLAQRRAADERERAENAYTTADRVVGGGY